MRKFLAIDAGGTRTRAAVIDAASQVLGVGRAGSGNPTSAGVDGAVDGIATCAERAFAAAAIPADDVAMTLIALAGIESPTFEGHLLDRLASSGFHGTIRIESDLLGTYFSGTCEPNGYALIAGTGAVAARVTHGELELVSGGTGWLVGDAGSGFWIGHQVVRTVAAALDGQHGPTALTQMLSTTLGLQQTTDLEQGRPRLLSRMIDELYALRPVELSRFAPLAFAAPDDSAAGAIIESAIDELIALVSVVLDSRRPGPIVLGGSVLKQGFFGQGHDELARRFGDRLTMRAPGAPQVVVSDGLTGAAVLALRAVGIPVGQDVFPSLREQLTMPGER